MGLEPDFDLSIATRGIPNACHTIRSRSGQIKSLKIRSKDGDFFPDELADVLRTSANLDGINRLQIEEIDLGRAALEAIVESPFYRELETLELIDCDWHSKLGDEILQLICDSETLNPVSLDLESSPITADGIRTLVDNLPSRLKKLRLAGTAFSNEGLRILLESDRIGQLRSIDLVENEVTGEGAEFLSSCKPAIQNKVSFFEHPHRLKQ